MRMFRHCAALVLLLTGSATAAEFEGGLLTPSKMAPDFSLTTPEGSHSA